MLMANGNGIEVENVRRYANNEGLTLNTATWISNMKEDLYGGLLIKIFRFIKDSVGGTQVDLRISAYDLNDHSLMSVDVHGYDFKIFKEGEDILVSEKLGFLLPYGFSFLGIDPMLTERHARI